MSRIMIRRGTLSLHESRPGGRLHGGGSTRRRRVAVQDSAAASAASPVVLAYRAGRRASGEDVNDSDSPGNPSLHEPRPRGRFRGNGSTPEAPLRAVGRLAYRAEQCVSREDVDDSDSPGNPSARARPRGTVSWQWQYAGSSPCAPSVAWHIAPDAAHRGKMSRIAIHRGTLSARTAPRGDGFVAIAARRKPPCAPSVVWHITPDAAHRGKMSRIVIHREALSARTAPPGDGFVAMAARRKPPARRRSFGISRRTMRIAGKWQG